MRRCHIWARIFCLSRDTGGAGANKHTYDFGFYESKMSVKKTAYSKTVRGGRKVEFKIVIKNEGSSPLKNIEACDNLPGALTFVRASGARFESGRACWRVSQLESGSRKTLKLTARADRGTGDCGMATNVATVGADGVSQVSRKASVRVRCAGGARAGGATG